MAELAAAMPVLPLSSDCTVAFEAIDPTTGAAVTGVTIARATIYAVDVDDGDTPKFEPLPPLLTYGPGTGA